MFSFYNENQYKKIFMKYAFFGSPEFASIILEKLIGAKIPPALVVTNPDRPVGRKKIVTPPPVKRVALDYNNNHDNEKRIGIFQPEKLEIRNWELEIDKLGGLDFCVVAAYSKIISKEVLDTLPAKFVGVHPSLLPKYRGATPIQSAILEGAEQTGVTLYSVDEKVDHGPILAQQALYENLEHINYETLMRALAELASEMLVSFLPEFVKGEIAPEAQNESEATYTKKFENKDAYVDPVNLSEAQNGTSPEKAVEIYRKVRALNPEPGVFTLSLSKGGLKKRMKILEAELADEKIVLKKIQFEGGKPQTL